MRRFRVVFSLICVLSAAVAVAQDSAELAAKLEKIRLGVSQHEAEIARIRAEFNALLKQRKEAEAAVSKLKQEERKLLEKVDKLSRDRDVLVHKVQAAEERVSEEQLKVSRRLRALYMGSSAYISHLNLLRTGGSEMEKIAVYVRAVRSSDDLHIGTVKAAVQELAVRRNELEQSYNEQKSAQDAATVTRTSAEAQASKLKVLGEQLSQKRKTAEVSLAKLRKEAERLEVLMAEIMSADTTALSTPASTPEEQVVDNFSVPTLETPRQGAESDAPGPSGAAVAPASIQLVPGGLFASAARVSAPVKGALVQKFGKVKVTEFADMIFSKGLEFSAAVGAEVFAVLAGKVAFVGNLPGYETVVVVDHGARSYSLYGRLASSAVKTGDMLAQDQSLGVTGEPDPKGRNFYFEVRKNGSPVDPQRILRRLSR